MFLYNQKEYDNGEALPYRTQGIAGRLSYTYDSRYIAELNFGYNGSENFAKGKRFGFFPAVALGWIVSSEKVHGAGFRCHLQLEAESYLG